MIMLIICYTVSPVWRLFLLCTVFSLYDYLPSYPLPHTGPWTSCYVNVIVISCTCTSAPTYMYHTHLHVPHPPVPFFAIIISPIHTPWPKTYTQRTQTQLLSYHPHIHTSGVAFAWTHGCSQCTRSSMRMAQLFNNLSSSSTATTSSGRKTSNRWQRWPNLQTSKGYQHLGY